MHSRSGAPDYMYSSSIDGILMYDVLVHTHNSFGFFAPHILLSTNSNSITLFVWKSYNETMTGYMADFAINIMTS